MAVATKPPEPSGEPPLVAFPEGLARPDPALEGAIVESIARLWSPELGVYAEAAKRLMAIGEPSVPYLGYYGDVEKEIVPGQRMSIARCVVDPILETLPPDLLSRHLRSPYRQVRASAAIAVGKRRLREHLPALLDLLEDPETLVRAAANTSLRMVTNRFLAFRADAPAPERAAAVARWRAYAASPEGQAALEGEESAEAPPKEVESVAPPPGPAPPEPPPAPEPAPSPTPDPLPEPS